jgi:ATP-dependent exoDNAse (exonuclease V) beta subunit
MDVLIDFSSNYIRKVNIGKFAICEVNQINNIDNNEQNIIIKTMYKEYLNLKNKKIFKIESDGEIRDMFFCKIITYEELLKTTKLNPELINYDDTKPSIQVVSIIYARCVNSMNFLDKIYRDYLYKHKFSKGDILAVKSVAGSGKTTTLLELSKIHSSKKILYIAFNKSLITEVKDKISTQKITNLIPYTFDALMRDVFIAKTDLEDVNIIDLKPQNISDVVEWFNKKPYKLKNYFIKYFSKFCNQTKYSDMKTYCEKVLGGDKKLLNTMWQKTLSYDLITFDSIRKLVEINHWAKGYLDKKYDMIFIDESQDFDSTMLKILLEDTTIPKLFVGDTRQAIYEWKGSINAFDKLPSNSLILEFYSTFRVGNPACDEIRDKFENCWMISKSSNVTHIKYDIIPAEKYVYLFRSWKSLILTAQNLSNIWINNYETQINYIKSLHSKLQNGYLGEDDLDDQSDDLPKFLLKLSVEELEKLITNMEKNIVSKKDCAIELYTIHTYKGLESEIVRIYNDIDIKNEQNLYYVALTRGFREIIIDTKIPIYDEPSSGKKQTSVLKYGMIKVKKTITKKPAKGQFVLDDFISDNSNSTDSSSSINDIK